MTTAPLDADNLLADLLKQAKAAGADAADAVVAEGVSLSLARRLGKSEGVERAEGRDLGLRVIIGKRQAIVSASDFSPAAMKELVGRAVAMAKAVPEDKFCGIAEPGQIAKSFPDLDTCDMREPSPADMDGAAAAAEDAARAVKGVTNSEGAEAGWSLSRVHLAISNGFSGSYGVSRHSLSVSVLAGEGTGMETDYDFATGISAADLTDPRELGRNAGERAVKKLNPRKASTAQVPVVYDPRVAGGLVSSLAGAVNGASIARGTSFLKDSMGKAVFAKGISIIDDPRRLRGLRSKPFDGEGFATSRHVVIEDGVLQTWFLDLSTGRQLDLPSTGHAARGTGSPPSPSATNLYLAAGALPPKELIADIKQGFYVTQLMGMGTNLITGDYSRGASGFWIENGEIAYPVSEVTVAGNLRDMFMHLTPANDLTFRYGTDSPTLRIEGMTVAGQSA
ncbi:MAG TPA: TldD/PmbA family protein [Alphaproteobacteria bacterium]|jgi:PmbA protein